MLYFENGIFTFKNLDKNILFSELNSDFFFPILKPYFN